MIVTEGSTDVSVPFYFVDDVAGTNPGEPTTGLLFSDIETGGSASYQRQGAARVDFTLQTLASAAAAHADGGFILVDDTEMPGVYRCDIPDAAVAAGVDFVIIYLRAAAAKNTITRPLKIDLTSVDLRDSVRGGMTALPNAAADGAGGLPISDAGGLDLDAKLANTNEVTAARMGALTDWIDGGRLDLILDAVVADTNELQTNQGAWATATSVTVSDKTGFSLSSTGADLILKSSTFALAMADAVWDEVLTAATHNVAASAGRRLRDIASDVIYTGTAVSATANTLTQAADALAVDGSYDPSVVITTGGTGIGQVRGVLEYYGSAGNGNAAKTLILDRDWKVTPDGTTEFVIVARDGSLSTNEGQVTVGGTTGCTLNSLAPSNGELVGQTIQFRSGTGQDQKRRILTHTAQAVTFDALDVAVDATTAYQILPFGVEKTGYSLASTGLDLVLVDTKTVPEALQIMGAVLAGKIADAGTTTETFVGLDGTTTRVTATLDTSGNRTNVVYS